MIEDKATEKMKNRLKDMGLIVNMGADRAKPPAGTGKHVTDKKSVAKNTSGDKKRGKK